jgi:hypothetical protein
MRASTLPFVLLAVFGKEVLVHGRGYAGSNDVHKHHIHAESSLERRLLISSLSSPVDGKSCRIALLT